MQRLPSCPDHEPRRPEWTCQACGTPWPCPPARTGLAEQYRDTPIVLAIEMGVCLSLAAAEVPHRVPTAELYERFVEWPLAMRVPLG